MIVYLDSQDYSNIATPPRGREAFFESLGHQLQELADSGDIKIRYSAIHVSEIAHTTADAMKYSVPRARMLKQLSAGKCMRFWNCIADEEVLANFDPDQKVVATNDNDLWFETDMRTLRTFVEHFRESMEETLKERGVNRKARRKAAKLDIKGFITGTEQGRNALAKLANSLNEQFSLDEKLNLEMLTSYVMGSVGKERFENYVRRIMFDPVSLISKLSPEFDLESKLPRIVRDRGQNLVDKLNPSLEKIQQAITRIPKTELHEPLFRDIREMPRNIAANIRRSLVQSSLEENGKGAIGKKPLSNGQIDGLKVPIINTFSGILNRYLDQTVSAAYAGAPLRYFRLSDAADLFHAAYLPHVDVFRCDSAWTNLFLPEQTKYQVNIVGKVEDLLPTIRRRLNTP